jgi:beta-barrel assembly-enhancing protease
MNTTKYILLFLLLLSAFSGCATNPITGQEELVLSPVEDDFKLGHKFAPLIEEHLDNRIPDEGLQRYLDRIGQHIAGICHHPDWEYHYVAVNHPSINALALPGGYIYITRGMLEKIQSESQLAAILAHETAHVVARDTAAAMTRQTGMTLLTMATLISGQAPREVQQLVLITNQFLSLSYSRQDEREADLAGLDYLVDAGYDPNGMVETMQILQEAQTRRPIEFYSTHPLPANRIRYLKQRISIRYGDVLDGKTDKNTYKAKVLDYLAANDPPKKKKRKTGEQNKAKSLQTLPQESGLQFRVSPTRSGTYIQ